jgi:hypothetical protein
MVFEMLAAAGLQKVNLPLALGQAEDAVDLDR